MTKKLPIQIIFLLFYKVVISCNICGGGTTDIGVLALDGRALFGFGLSYDHYLGVWDETGKWIKSQNSQSQTKAFLGGAYRINKHIQFGLSVPFIWNYNNIPGLMQNGNGFGDITINSRYEFFHEFQIKKVKGKNKLDKVLPYFAITFGLILPTGRSIETAENETDITGKGFYTTSLGFSLTKTLIRNKLQVTTDLNWQHSFKKSYIKYFNQPTDPFSKQAGDKYNYSLTMNYIFGSEAAVFLVLSGFLQNSYSMNGETINSTDEKAMNISTGLSYYPDLKIRITPTFKYSLAGNSFGKNSTGSYTAGVSITYYIPDYNIK